MDQRKNSLQFDSMTKAEQKEFAIKHNPVYDLITEYMEKEFNWWKWSCIEYCIQDGIYYVFDYDDNLKYQFTYSDGELSLYDPLNLPKYEDVSLHDEIIIEDEELNEVVVCSANLDYHLSKINDAATNKSLPVYEDICPYCESNKLKWHIEDDEFECLECAKRFHSPKLGYH